MRIMAIDLGDRHTGVCFSDKSGTLAGQSFTIDEYDRERLADKIAEAARENQAERIVVGNPKNMNSTAGERSEKSRVFAEKIGQMTGLDTVLWDERVSTVSALRILSDAGKKRKKQKQLVDSVAAAIILQNYLDYLALHPEQK